MPREGPQGVRVQAAGERAERGLALPPPPLGPLQPDCRLICRANIKPQLPRAVVKMTLVKVLRLRLAGAWEEVSPSPHPRSQSVSRQSAPLTVRWAGHAPESTGDAGTRGKPRALRTGQMPSEQGVPLRPAPNTSPASSPSLVSPAQLTSHLPARSFQG